MQIGLFGGSFDPVHNGHLAVAEACLAAGHVEEVWFTPTAIQPHKSHGPAASNEHRVQMLRLAVADRPGLVLSMIEIERGGVSYTINTLQELATAYPANAWQLLMGADTLHDLPNWREPKEILRLATPLVVCRPGEPAPDFGVLAPLVASQRQGKVVAMPPCDISSSELRSRIAHGKSISDSVPSAVVEFIEREQLYR